MADDRSPRAWGMTMMYEAKDEHGRVTAKIPVVVDFETGAITLKDPVTVGDPEEGSTAYPASKICASCGSKPGKALCSSCFEVGYCSKACQTAHWTAGHKSDCPTMASAAIDEALATLGGKQELVERMFKMMDQGRLPARVSSALEKLAKLTWTQRARRNDAVLLHLCAVEVLVALERYANDQGLRPDGLNRAKGLLQRAATMDPSVLPHEDQEDAYVPYINCLKLLATVGERPLEATERMKVVYSHFEARIKKTDPWLLASILLCLISATVACAEEAEMAKDGASSRAHLMEAKEAGQKFLRLVRSASQSPDRDVAVSLAAQLKDTSCKLVKLRAPDLGTMFARMSLDLAPRFMAAECYVVLSQALLASRRLEEALRAAVQGSEVARRTSPDRADALVRAALACLELGDAGKAVSFAREGWELGCRLWKDMEADRTFGRMPEPHTESTLGYVVGIGGSSLADGLAGLGRSNEALAVDKVTRRMTGNMSEGMLLRRGLDEYARGDTHAAIQTLREAADRDHIFWTYHAKTVEQQRMAVDELIRMLKERGTEADLAEAEERKALLQRLQAEEEELRGAALEEARVAMLPLAEKRKARADIRRKSGSKQAGSKKGGKSKAKGGRKTKKKQKKGQAGKSTTTEAGTAGKGKDQKQLLAAEAPVAAKGEPEANDVGGKGATGAVGASEEGAEEQGHQEEAQQEEEEEEEECCVCLLPLIDDDSDDPLGFLACGHSLHDACIDAWNSCCQNKGIPATCPLCRSSLIRR